MGTRPSDAFHSSFADQLHHADDAAVAVAACSSRGGYKNPPADKQFQKGQPRPEGAGRQKGTLNRSTIQKALHKFFLEQAVVVKSKDGTSSRHVPRFEALLATSFDRAIKGNSRDTKVLLGAITNTADDTEESGDRMKRLVMDLSLDEPWPTSMESIL